MLSSAAGASIFIAATLYGFGKTFFWPTMLGVVAEQTPKGGAMTLNAISGIGMLAVGTLGFPYIGTLQADKQIEALVASEPAQRAGLVNKDRQFTAVSDKTIYEIIKYKAVDDKAVAAAIEQLPEEDRESVTMGIKHVGDLSNQKALANMAIFPGIMLVGYLALILYFRAKGGYKAEILVGHGAEDGKFTGGVNGPADA
jgi:hypothetical protein